MAGTRRTMENMLRTLVQRAGVTRRVQPLGASWTDDLRAVGVRPEVIIDAGANVGQTAVECARAFPQARIHAFEPIPETHAKLVANTRRLPQVTAVNVALSDRSGTAEMAYDPANSELSTLDAGGTADGAGTRQVALRTLDEYVAESGIGRIDVLKVDTEGHELQVLRGAERALPAVSFVKCEVDFSDEPTGHAKFGDVQAFLRRHDFHVGAFYCEGLGERGWLWGDVLFVRAGVVRQPRYWARHRLIPIGLRRRAVEAPAT